MKKQLLIVLSIFVLTSLACTINIPWIPRVGEGELETFTFSQNAPEGADVVNVDIKMGAGTLEITGGSNTLIEGTVEYNIEGWEPRLLVSDRRITVEQESEDITNIPTRNLRNEWDVRLGDETPIALTVEAGAYEGTLELGGIPLADLSISDGASNATVNFEQPNPVDMDTLRYSTGFSDVELIGLGNANFRSMDFSGGAGSYRLDFSGALQRDANVRISGGGSNVEIIVPQGTRARIEMTGSVSNTNTTGEWSVSNNVYTTEGSGPGLDMVVDVGVGNITLISR